MTVSAAPPQSSTADLIERAKGYVDAGRYADALKVVVGAKALEPRNIYLIALEKQLLKLSTQPNISAEEKKQLLGQLPSLYQRAAGASKPANPGESGRVGFPSQTDTKGKQEKLQALKNQYFERADEFLERGDYQSALAEVRRVLIIDPGNSVAKKYEEKINQLASSQAKAAAAAEQALKSTGKVKPDPLQSSGKAKADALRSSGKVKETVSRSGRRTAVPPPVAQQESLVAEPDAASEPVQAPEGIREEVSETKGSSKGLFIGIGAVVVVAAIAAFFFLRPAQQPPADPNAANQPAQVAQQTPAEQPAATGGAPTNTAQPAASPATTAKGKETPATTPASTPSQSQSKKTEEKKDAGKTENAAKPQHQQQAQNNQPAPQPVQQKPAAQPAPAQQQQTQTASTAPPQPAQPAPAQAENFVPVQARVVKQERPRVTPILAKIGAAKVVIRVMVDSQGKPSKTEIVSSTNSLFNDICVDAVMRSQYSPAVSSAGPTSSWLVIPFSFR